MNDLLKRTFHVPGLGFLDRLIRSLSRTGKVVFLGCALVFAVSALGLLWQLNNSFLVVVPARGGTLSEGVIGVPHFVNPLLAVTDGDKDMVALVYSGLMRDTPDGALIPDLADHYTISPDGLTYDFVLRNNLTFHDGTPLTADDVMFTVQSAENPATKSPEQAVWAGVSATKVSDREIVFKLTQPYAPFLENTTLGILPRHIFAASGANAMDANTANISPVGSGPYKLKSIARGKDGVATSYTFGAFDAFALGKPFISDVTIKFYPNEQAVVDAYQNGDIDAMNSISPDTASNFKNTGSQTLQAALPRIFALFFNQTSNEALAQPEVRKALALAVDREYIVNTVLRGFGTPLTSAVPQEYVPSIRLSSVASTTAQIDSAKTLLEKNGWTLNSQGIYEKKTKKGPVLTLAFSISTGDAPELKQVADILKDELHAIGADVDIKVFEGGYLNQNIIKPRKYDALLFGQVVNRDLDVYAFWHSSEIADPGLNVAMYSNKKADKYLENIRILQDRQLREAEYEKFDEELQNDMPAVFLYSPNFIYTLSPDIHNVKLSEASVPSDRFGSIYTWYINTDKIWKIFIRNQ